jgi:hypothetical protein
MQSANHLSWLHSQVQVGHFMLKAGSTQQQSLWASRACVAGLVGATMCSGAWSVPPGARPRSEAGNYKAPCQERECTPRVIELCQQAGVPPGRKEMRASLLPWQCAQECSPNNRCLAKVIEAQPAGSEQGMYQPVHTPKVHMYGIQVNFKRSSVCMPPRASDRFGLKQLLPMPFQGVEGEHRDIQRLHLKPNTHCSFHYGPRANQLKLPRPLSQPKGL